MPDGAFSWLYAAQLTPCYPKGFIESAVTAAEFRTQLVDIASAHPFTPRVQAGGDMSARRSACMAELRTIDRWSDALTLAVDDLALSASQANVFAEPWFLVPSMTHLANRETLRLFLLWSGPPEQSKLIGIWSVSPNPRYSRWPIPHVQNWMHHNCFLGLPLVRAGCESMFWREFLCCCDERQDWPGFLHINSLERGSALELALLAVCQEQHRPCDLVAEDVRALLQSDLSPEEYLAHNMRGKKRKELRRQQSRLADMGKLTFTNFGDDNDLDGWIEDFLTLECKGWKGQNGSALSSAPETQAFFRDVVRGAAQAGKLQRRSLLLDGKPLAMLVNFVTNGGAFSFKTCFDEDYARFSPGVLLQIGNLDNLHDPDIPWIDSCAAEDHPMIDSLWAERRRLGRYSVALSGVRRQTIFRAVRLGETAMSAIKGRKMVSEMAAEAGS